MQHGTLFDPTPNPDAGQSAFGAAPIRCVSPRMSCFWIMQSTPAAFSPLHNLFRLFCRSQGTHKSTIVAARDAEIGAANDGVAAAKLDGVFRLQRPKRSLSAAFTALRRNLNRVATT